MKSGVYLNFSSRKTIKNDNAVVTCTLPLSMLTISQLAEVKQHCYSNFFLGGWGCNPLNPSPGSASAWGSDQISVYEFSANEKQSQNQSSHIFRCEALLKMVYAISTENNFYYPRRWIRSNLFYQESWPISCCWYSNFAENITNIYVSFFCPQLNQW